MAATTPARSKQSGFTLIETILAMLILAIALLAMAQLVAVAISQNSMSRTGSVSISVAQGQLEQLRALYNGELENPAVPVADLTVGSHGPVEVRLAGYGGGDRVYLVRWMVTQDVGKEKTVRVAVEPQAQNYLNTRSVAITSHFAP